MLFHYTYYSFPVHLLKPQLHFTPSLPSAVVAPSEQRSRGRGRWPTAFSLRPSAGCGWPSAGCGSGSPSLLAKLREQQPDLAAGNKEVREALAVLKAESKAPEAAAAPATEVKRDWTKNADAALSAAEESTSKTRGWRHTANVSACGGQEGR